MITAIIVTYNRCRFLVEAINSVLAQTYFIKNPQDWELLVIDDGSTDETGLVVSQYLQTVPNIRYYAEPHRGVSAARNRGLALARGDFIAFLDSDDLWLPSKIEVQMSYLRAFPSAPFCLAEEIWIRRGRRVNQARKHQKSSGYILEKALSLCLLSLSSAVFRRQLFEELGQFDENLPVCEDYDLGIRIALRYPYYYLSSPLIVKRGGHADQLSQKYWGNDRWRVEALLKALASGVDEKATLLIKKEIKRKATILAGGFRKRGQLCQAEYYENIINSLMI
ncbi:MAG TPA: glycosyltransferase [Candidatus Saccharicenans sp.]|jgi:glycosyltransferase involved in cell wall biosynthesis|nr:glycosyltransferase [Candidatus Saccharicenans sp.]HRD02211.1 glycosyltransferase [Candidatus Saccharicenans sp.]